MSFILNLNIFVSILIILILSTLLSFIILKLIRKRYSHDYLKQNHEVAGFIFNAFCFIYAVLLSFIVYINWAQYDDANKNSYNEANQIISINRLVNIHDKFDKPAIKNLLAEYCNNTINNEWKEMKNGMTGNSGEEIISKLEIRCDNLKSQSEYRELVIDYISRINSLSAHRNLRYMFLESTIPTVIWAVLLICSSLTIIFPYFFGMQNKRVHNITVISFTVINLLILFLVYLLDHPYSGDYGISPQPFINALNNLR